MTDTSAVKVTATTVNAEVAAAICNDLTKVAPKYVEDAVGVGSINTIDTAKVYHSPVAPNIPKYTMVGFAAGFMLIVMLILLIDFFDNTIKDPDVLANKYHKAIIGEIQQFGDGKKKISDEKKWLTHCLTYFMADKILNDVYKIQNCEIIYENNKPIIKEFWPNRTFFFYIPGIIFTCFIGVRDFKAM